MNTRRIAAVLIALFIILVPFKKAFLTDDNPGIMMIASFIATVLGIVVFYRLTMKSQTPTH
ncbi:MAG: hypothetical protein ACKPB3_00120 [Bacteroidota bacterium]